MSHDPVYAPPCEGKSTHLPLSDADLEQLQSQIGQLPNDYLSFLRQWNTLRLAESMWFPLADALDDDDVGSIGVFYGVGSEKSGSDLRYGNTAYNFQNRVPAGFHSIGRDMSWDFVCIKLGEENFGSIHYWSPGEGWPEDEEVASTEYLCPVASSFWEFWSMLKHEHEMNFTL